MNKKYIIAFLITIGLFYLIFKEYHEHLNAFHEQNLIESTVVDIHCGKRSNIAVQISGEKEYVRLLRKTCYQLSVGDKVTLIKGYSGKLFWNHEPTKRIFWLIPIYVLIVGYILFWNYRKKIKTKPNNGEHP